MTKNRTERRRAYREFMTDELFRQSCEIDERYQRRIMMVVAALVLIVSTVLILAM